MHFRNFLTTCSGIVMFICLQTQQKCVYRDQKDENYQFSAVCHEAENTIVDQVNK